MLRVVELDIDGELSGDTGVWEIAWVEMPAIEREMIFFSKELEFVYPGDGETQDEFIGRCMGDTQMVGEFPDSEQRAAVCYSYWDRKNEFAIGNKVSFDWDVLKTPKGIVFLEQERRKGGDVYILSTAGRISSEIWDLARKYNINSSKIFLVGGNLERIKKVKELGIVRHYDNDGLVRNELGNVAVQFDYDISALPAYDNYPSSGNSNSMLIEETFETHNDYPEGARNNACRAIKWKEENGSDCGTQVGWTRARQLCNGENISRETIARMASFERHRQNSDVPYSEGCGGIMWDAWGGDSGIRWAQNKLDEIDREEMSMDYEDMEIDVFGYQTRFFYMCPGATSTFEHLKTMNPNEDIVGMIRSAAQIADNIFRIEAEVIEKNEASKEDLDQATILVDDFKDLMREIDELVGMSHDVSYMDGHIMKIQSLLLENFLYENPCEDGWVAYGTKEKNGRTVPNCVPIEQKRQFDRLGFTSDMITEEELELINAFESLLGTQKFQAVTNPALRGFTKSEVMKQNHKQKTTYYEYKRVDTGSPDRDFCSSIEGRFFRISQIYAMEGLNKQFGHNQDGYSKWLYKGGPNCVHAWSKWEALQKDFREIGMVSGKPGTPPKQMPNQGYYSEKTKAASQRAYWAQQNMSSQTQQLFKGLDEKRLIYTPLMVPNILIPRLDEVSGERYFVKFRPEVIEKIQQKFMIEQRLRETNYEHTNEKFNDAVMVESWIVQGDSDKAYSLGFSKEQVPPGTWMGGYKILETPEGDSLWNKFIKTGKVKGMSVEGNFLLEFSRFKKDDYLLEQVINILKTVE
jgi:hypothetical protein